MKKIRLLGVILKRTKASQFVLGFLGYLLVFAFIINLVEPGIESYGQALWYCYSVTFTVGLGDVVVTTLIAKILSVIMTVYATFVIAIMTGVVVNYYTEIRELQRNESMSMYMDKLERLPELSKEELEEMSKQVRKFR